LLRDKIVEMAKDSRMTLVIAPEKLKGSYRQARKIYTRYTVEA